MIETGKYNELEVLKDSAIGFFLGEEGEEILLPRRYVPAGVKVGDALSVFVYLDNENRPVATTSKPYATVGQFGFLKAKEVNTHGAFLDWGIDKDIFVPYSEQRVEMEAGKQYLVFLYIDVRSGRIAASSKWKQFIDNDLSELENGDEVELIIAEKSDLGYKAVVNHKYEGLLYHNEIFDSIHTGDVRRGYIKLLREDGKIDLSLQQQGYEHITDSKVLILHYLKENNGLLPLGDKSTPEEIYSRLKISKKAFKKTIGGLYKERLITISDHEVALIAAD